MEPDPEVIIGTSNDGAWTFYKNDPRLSPKRISMTEASAQVAAHFKCTPENARDSLLKHGYASSPGRDWRVAGRGFDEKDRW